MTLHKPKAIIGAGILGLLLLPIASGAATSDTTVNATVNSQLDLTSSSPVSLSLTPGASGYVVSSASGTATVTTNNSTGYTLKLGDKDATVNLNSGGNNITAHTGTPAAPTTLSLGTWGWRSTGVGSFGATGFAAETNSSSSTTTWAGVAASGSDFTVKTTAVAATGGDTTTFWYGAKVDKTQATGTYTDIITYTATANP
jgi:hypothetical protein